LKNSTVSETLAVIVSNTLYRYSTLRFIAECEKKMYQSTGLRWYIETCRIEYR
jgi:hypothetical protein